MVVELTTHIGQGVLTDDRLQYVDEKLEPAGGQKCTQIDGAIGAHRSCAFGPQIREGLERKRLEDPGRPARNTFRVWARATSAVPWEAGLPLQKF